MKDLFGKALLDYFNDEYVEDLITATNISSEDVLPLPYLFRDYDAMPKIEQKALQLAKGDILDVGCGAGSHALYLQERGMNVKAIDLSRGAIEVCRKRGLKQAEVLNICDESGTYDTIIILMNGSGIFKTVSQTPRYLNHIKSLLNTDGQILIDSSDIIYMFDDDEIESLKNQTDKYYGELDYFISYKGETEEVMAMLYLDFETLKKSALETGLQCEMVAKGPHFDYLAKLTRL
ncbi:MAG: methyltransferase domain-containing protein [Bacteroidia bacterium]|nr:methyltransferase domain-containing protein [Bacteroidia bacterium]NND52608.1 methyltransferase domain-containing protein [Flavobacteriaceae bacterium]